MKLAAGHRRSGLRARTARRRQRWRQTQRAWRASWCASKGWRTFTRSRWAARRIWQRGAERPIENVSTYMTRPAIAPGKRSAHSAVSCSRLIHCASCPHTPVATSPSRTVHTSRFTFYSGRAPCRSGLCDTRSCTHSEHISRHMLVNNERWVKLIRFIRSKPVRRARLKRSRWLDGRHCEICRFLVN